MLVKSKRISLRRTTQITTLPTKSSLSFCLAISPCNYLAGIGPTGIPIIRGPCQRTFIIGDMDGVWTDSTTYPFDPTLWHANGGVQNVANDGILDPGYDSDGSPNSYDYIGVPIAGDANGEPVELSVGRVDMHDIGKIRLHRNVFRRWRTGRPTVSRLDNFTPAISITYRWLAEIARD